MPSQNGGIGLQRLRKYFHIFVRDKITIFLNKGFKGLLELTKVGAAARLSNPSRFFNVGALPSLTFIIEVFVDLENKTTNFLYHRLLVKNTTIRPFNQYL